MDQTVFLKTEFFLLVLCSIVMPIGIYSYLLGKRAISRLTVILLGVILVVISGVDLLLLQKLKSMVQLSSSVFDDAIFASELTIALYLLPAFFAGIGINLVSHVVIRHLNDAEQRFDQQEADSGKRSNQKPST